MGPNNEFHRKFTKKLPIWVISRLRAPFQDDNYMHPYRSKGNKRVVRGLLWRADLNLTNVGDTT